MAKAKKLTGSIALKADQTVSPRFSLNSGDHVLAAGGVSGVPSTVTSIDLQYRFLISTDKAGAETWSQWSSAGTLPDNSLWVTVFQSSPNLEYRINPNAAGAVVHVSPVALTVYSA